jgi:hypothetical protein
MDEEGLAEAQRNTGRTMWGRRGRARSTTRAGERAARRDRRRWERVGCGQAKSKGSGTGVGGGGGGVDGLH